jgi:cytochrome c-type biogenesis protein CcmE
MTRKQRRLGLIAAALATLGVALALVLVALRDSIVFFYAPSDLIAKPVRPGTRLRLGGLVETGSIVHGGNQTVRFIVTDTVRAVPVSYTGLLPDLFREGQGVVTEGVVEPDGSFRADSVLAKHDETYMPREVADALRQRGVWQGGAGAKAEADTRAKTGASAEANTRASTGASTGAKAGAASP